MIVYEIHKNTDHGNILKHNGMVNVRHCLSNAAWKHSSFKVSLSLLIAILFISLFSIYMAQKNVNGKTNVADMVQQAAGDNLKLNLVLYLCFYFCWCLFLYIYICICICICIFVGDKTNVADAGQEGTGDDLKCFSREST